MSDAQVHAGDVYTCPYCNQRPLEAVASAPYVRGLIVVMLFGTKSFIGCVPCVRSRMLGEAGWSMLLGWFSPKSLIINPFLIVYNVFRGALVGANPAGVGKKLRELGLPEKPSFVNVQAVGVALAASMILADGEVTEEEIATAEKAGDGVFDGFDEAGLRMILQHGKDLPPAEDLAAMLRNVLDNDGKTKVMVFLSEIAMADGNVSQEEREMLQRIAGALGVQAQA
jgi:uncharacterized tellurite resistance protein B-like protein